jgi:hypothetical protein
VNATAIWRFVRTEAKSALAFRKQDRWARLQFGLLGLLILVQIADLITCSVAIGALGLSTEQNPLARAIYIQAGLVGLAALKGVAICILLALIIRFFPRDWSATVLIAGFVAISSIGAISNMNAYYNSPRLYVTVGHLSADLEAPGNQPCGILCLEGPNVFGGR